MALLQTIIITSLFCNGLQIVTGPGMLFDFVTHKLEEVTLLHPRTEIIYKPLLGCIKCMASVWGIVISLLLLPVTPMLIIKIPIICICSSALNVVIYGLYE